MKIVSILLTFLPNLVFAANIYWFERVDSEIKNLPGITDVSYRPGTPNDASFTFTKGGKKLSVWVNFGFGQNAVYGFTNQDGSNGVVTVQNDKLEVGQGNMFDQMTALHRRGNLTAGDMNRSVSVLNNGQQVELQSGASENALKLSIVKLKKMDNGDLSDIHLSFSLSGTDDSKEALDTIKTLRPMVEKQIEF